MLFFEFLSGLNHAYHVIGEATQEHSRHIHGDIRQMTRDSKYADEQQDEAVKKEEKRKKQLAMLELAFGLIIALFSLLTAAGALLLLRSLRKRLQPDLRRAGCALCRACLEEVPRQVGSSLLPLRAPLSESLSRA